MSTIERIGEFKQWVTENLGEQTGEWYTPYLKRLGFLLDTFDICHGYKENFFEYETYEEFKQIYIQITGQKEEDIEEILKGKRKRYHKEFGKDNAEWNKQYAKYTYERNERSSPENYGGIVNLGPLLRSYLKFLYYSDNPNEVYPVKEKKIANQEDRIDNSVNYWLLSVNDDNEIIKVSDEGILSMDCFLSNKTQYKTDKEIEKYVLKEYAERNNVVINSLEEVDNVHGELQLFELDYMYDFFDMQEGDIIYIFQGTNKILAKGIITSDYYYDDTKQEFKHRRKLDWIKKGECYFNRNLPNKILTLMNEYPSTILEIEQTLNNVDMNNIEENEFKIWLSLELDEGGNTLDDEIIKQKISRLRDIERVFSTKIFGEMNIEKLKQLKDLITFEREYIKYKVEARDVIDLYINFVETKPVVEENEVYTASDFLEEVFINNNELIKLRNLLKNKKNLILRGAPGVGKTFIADRLAYVMMGEKSKSRIQMIQFHQSYSYEDFIEGYRPKAENNGFELRYGPFVKFARRAKRDPENDYFFIIDEINRGNMSKIFGELMMLIESDKRGKYINLLYSNEKFTVPENLYLIGMMNTADRSLALLDYALRRRFSFYEVHPAFNNKIFRNYVDSLKNKVKYEKVVEKIAVLNKTIIAELGSGFQIGHSYFVDDNYIYDADAHLIDVLKYEIIPQLYEYWFDDEQKAKEWAEELMSCYDEV